MQTSHLRHTSDCQVTYYLCRDNQVIVNDQQAAFMIPAVHFLMDMFQGPYWQTRVPEGENALPAMKMKVEPPKQSPHGWEHPF